MTLHAAYVAPGTTRDSDPDRIDVRFVKDGIAWPALVLPFVWLVWHRMWWVLAGFIAASLAVEAIGQLWRPEAATVLGLLLAVAFAVHANDLRCWSLERAGWRLAGVVEGKDRDTMELRFFTGLLVAPRRAAPPAASSPSPFAGAQSRPSGMPAVIGYLPATPRGGTR
ncbi:DUF2628 domain-containing protein [Methylobrevis pamukkalensis]|uniref:DUF2628 domain-containing protein n=1 Tax=Methylobrevis pamukkalensis TaxID=1439726 RepID=A0A1E3H1P5_9HYPH|nr:DUF2628 domain-containing protein [Methylobrevis pamukkalensis]ODN70253.1 hypothetical protein A6302_02405 [Methylobrevis pamukkalensis]